jgi:hypothetical protein
MLRIHIYNYDKCIFKRQVVETQQNGGTWIEVGLDESEEKRNTLRERRTVPSWEYANGVGLETRTALLSSLADTEEETEWGRRKRLRKDANYESGRPRAPGGGLVIFIRDRNGARRGEGRWQQERGGTAESRATLVTYLGHSYCRGGGHPR